MSSYPRVQFVDSPAVGATVRLDLNDGSGAASRRIEADFDPGVPTLEGDPDAVGQTFGFRSPRFTVQVKGAKSDALAFVSALSKEMLRRTNWLLFQPSAATQPLWFRVYRTGFQPLSLERVYGNTATGGNAAAGFPDVWRVEVPLVADAFAYGARVTMSTFQVVQSPADLTGPTRTAMRVVLPAIKGDAPTALRVTITPAASPANQVGAQSAWLVGCVAGSAAMTDTVINIGTGDSVTNISGTAAASADATCFGGSVRIVTVAAATPNLLPRFQVDLPTTIAPGRYKVLLRNRYTAAANKTLLFRLVQWVNGGGSSSSTGQTTTVSVTSADTGREFWVDLGEVSLPFAVNAPSDGGGTSPSSQLVVSMGTVDGSSSTVIADAMKLIPVDGPTVANCTVMKTFSTFTDTAITAGVAGTFDGAVESYWNRATASGAYVEATPILRGYFPVADPGAAQNLLLVMACDSGINSSSAVSFITALNAQSAVDVSYYPRYLHIGDGT
jgi:hypothetical protein